MTRISPLTESHLLLLSKSIDFHNGNWPNSASGRRWLKLRKWLRMMGAVLN